MSVEKIRERAIALAMNVVPGYGTDRRALTVTELADFYMKARNEALEEAAQVCNKRSDLAPGTEVKIGIDYCANRIRALKENTK